MFRAYFINTACLLLFLVYSNLTAQGVLLTENTLIKNVDGSFINLQRFDSIMDTNNYTLKLITDADKIFNHLQLLPKTIADRKIDSIIKEKNAPIKMGYSKIGKFKVTDYNGNTFDMKEHEQKVIFLHYWAKKFKKSYSNTTIDQLNELYEAYKTNDSVSLISVNFDVDLTEEEKTNIATSIKMPLCFDGGEQLKKSLNLSDSSLNNMYPKFNLINKEGRRIYISPNFQTVDFFKQMINKELQKPIKNEP